MVLSLLGKVERITKNAINSNSRHHGFLNYHFSLCIGEDLSADGRIFALGILAHHDEVDISRLAVSQRRANSRHQANRPQADILVELPAELHERTPKRDMVRHLLGPAHRAEEDGVMTAYLTFPILGHHFAVLEVVIAGSEIERIEA